MIEFHFFWNANKNFRVAGRSGNLKHTFFFALHMIPIVDFDLFENIRKFLK